MINAFATVSAELSGIGYALWYEVNKSFTVMGYYVHYRM